MTALRDPGVLPDHDLAALLSGARWRRLAVLGDRLHLTARGHAILRALRAAIPARAAA